MTHLIRQRTSTIVLSIALCLAGCWDPGKAYPKLKPLGNGFIYWMSNPDNAFILEGDESGGRDVIPGHIDKIRREKEWIFGHITPYPYELAGTKTPESARGFFILNLLTGDKHLGMPEKQWRTALESHGVRNPKKSLKKAL